MRMEGRRRVVDRCKCTCMCQPEHLGQSQAEGSIGLFLLQSSQKMRREDGCAKHDG